MRRFWSVKNFFAFSVVFLVFNFTAFPSANIVGPLNSNSVQHDEPRNSTLESHRSERKLYAAQAAFDELLQYFANGTSGTQPPSESTLCATDGSITSLDTVFAWAERVHKRSALLRYVKQTSPRIFVAGLLRNNCDLALHYSVEILKLTMLYGTTSLENIFISLHESGSDAHDCTAQALLFLKKILVALKVPHSIRVGQSSRLPNRARIDFLQEIRNAALFELYSARREYDEVVYLSDSFFCASDIIRLLRHSDASIKCGIDLSVGGGTARFYDTWVAHDMTGNMFSNDLPFVQDETSKIAFKEGRIISSFELLEWSDGASCICVPPWRPL